jgi:hypothetical protein
MTALLSSCFALPYSTLLQAFKRSVIPDWWYIPVGVFILFAIYRLTKRDPEKEKDTMYKHHYFHFEDFQLSAQDFYQTLSDIIAERAFPAVRTEIRALSVGGFLKGKRDYLIIFRGDLVYYVCAAPFGKNFFISYWLRELPEGCNSVFMRRVFGAKTQSRSLYDIDTELMFQAGVTTAISKAVNQVTEARGMRKFHEHELIPKISQ